MSSNWVKGPRGGDVPAEQVAPFVWLARGDCPECCGRLSELVWIGTSEFLSDFTTEDDCRILVPGTGMKGRMDQVCEDCGEVYIVQLYEYGESEAKWILNRSHIQFRPDLARILPEIGEDWRRRLEDFSRRGQWWLKFSYRRSHAPSLAGRLAGMVVAFWHYWEDDDGWTVPLGNGQGWDHWFYQAAEEIYKREGGKLDPHQDEWWEEYWATDPPPSCYEAYMAEERGPGYNWAVGGPGHPDWPGNQESE